jgi:DNA repair protein RadD
MMKIELRPHQVQAIYQLRDSIRKGNKRPMLAAPCSMGKTFIAASIMLSAARKGIKSVFFCDRIKLVQQTVETFERLGADFSVLQGDDPRYDPRCLIQIASVQTAIRRNHLEFGLAIVDEAHTTYKGLVEGVMSRYTNVPFIGLSATPYSKGLGAIYDDLIMTITPRELIKQGYLCPTDYYAGRTVDLKGVKTKRLATGGSDYDPKALADAIESDTLLSGDIVENYRLHSNDLTRKAIAFTPSVAHSKELVRTFEAAGITACHIDGYMNDEERAIRYEGHANGDFLVLSCSRLLGVGYDDPSVEILIDCFPTKTSKIAFVQRAGRIWRTCEGKERATYLDHAGNLQRHGFPEDIIPESLDDGTKKFNELNQLKKEEKEPIQRTCPQCASIFVGRKCHPCGYELPTTAKLYHDSQLLEKVDKVAKHTKEDKHRWFNELSSYARTKNYSMGWVSHKYREKFLVWPKGIDYKDVPLQSPDVIGWLKHKQIAYAKGRARA